MRYRHRHPRALVLLCALFVLAGCTQNPPPNLSPVGVQAYRAAQAANVVTTVLRTAVNMHDAQLLSKRNTDTVVNISEVALKSLRDAPLGWRVTTTTALGEIAKQVDAEGNKQLAAWLKVAEVMVGEIR